jgi:glyoxylase-like metal-dependent hydrolase (beta-lactamase superfamily II)
MTAPAPASWAVDPAAARAFEVWPGIWRLRLPVPWHHLTHVNAYALDTADGGICLVDCGCAGHPTARQAFVRALGLAGRSLADVRELVATHFHSDHIGLAGPIVRETGCTLSGHRAVAHTLDPIRKPERTYATRAAFARRAGVPEELIDPMATVAEEVEGVEEPLEPQRMLTSGDVVESALGPWVVHETPGHAPSHICLYQPDARLLLVGDAVHATLNTYGDWGWTPDPIGEYRASLDVIDALDVALAFPGHGRPIEDLPALTAMYRTGIAERLEATARAVERHGPVTVWEATLEVLGRREPLQSMVWAVYEIANFLRHLELTGRVRDDGSGRYVVTRAGADARG